ncbi:MAG: yfeJ [Rhodocyclaceae bacterium]|nr:MAG: yfeJ [Rhodocyclaceae bacterium]TND01515.1 MAG: yfeJ [Rhodocyclaceae bacterium]
MIKTAAVIRHVHFEDLGTLESLLKKCGYTVQYHDVGMAPLGTIDPIETDLVIVLGAPIGACQEHLYPFVKDELGILEARLTRNRPTMGICLGAQLMARALGARVYPGPRQEIGFAPIQLTNAGKHSCLAPYGEEGATVLHWHSDTFDLPQGTQRLASTEVCENQAFSWGSNAIGLQFHPEAQFRGFERWLVGHACEIASSKTLSVTRLRSDAEKYFLGIEARAERCFGNWLDQLEP